MDIFACDIDIIVALIKYYNYNILRALRPYHSACVIGIFVGISSLLSSLLYLNSIFLYSTGLMLTATSVSMISQGCVFNELNNTTVKHNMLH